MAGWGRFEEAEARNPPQKFETYLPAASASIFSITGAREPPFTKTFPLAITRCPANFIKRWFWPVAGIESEIGQ